LKDHISVERDEKVRAGMSQAIHSLQAIMGPGIAIPLHESDTITRAL
jgi:hypothetical protein